MMGKKLSVAAKKQKHTTLEKKRYWQLVLFRLNRYSPCAGLPRRPRVPPSCGARQPCHRDQSSGGLRPCPSGIQSHSTNKRVASCCLPESCWAIRPACKRPIRTTRMISRREESCRQGFVSTLWVFPRRHFRGRSEPMIPCQKTLQSQKEGAGTILEEPQYPKVDQSWWEPL